MSRNRFVSTAGRSASFLSKETVALGFVSSLLYVWDGCKEHWCSGRDDDETAFDEFLGIAKHDFMVFASSTRILVSIDDEVSKSKQTFRING